MADYLIATISDRIQAEEVHLALQEIGLSEPNLNLFGKGYKTGEDCKDFDPALITKRQMQRMMIFLLPLGFVGGIIFYQTVRIDVLPSLGFIGNTVMGGLLGAASGALGGYITGGGLSLMLDKPVPYTEQIEAGTFLVVVRDAEDLKMRQANRVFRTLNIDNVAYYERPD